MSPYFLDAIPLVLSHTRADGWQVYMHDTTAPRGPAKALDAKRIVANLEHSMATYAAQYAPCLPDGAPFVIVARCRMSARKPNGWAKAKRSLHINVPENSLVIY
jgi:hypothetical protein